MRLRLEQLLITAIVAAVALRLFLIGSRELWYDEILTLILACGKGAGYHPPPGTPVPLSQFSELLHVQAPFSLAAIKGVLLGALATTAIDHPPLFWLSEHFWIAFFGTGAIALRSVSTVFSLLCIGASYLLGRCLLGRKGGLTLAALMSLSPLYFTHSITARMYAIVVFLAVLAAWSTIRLSCPSGKDEPLSGNQRLFWSAVLALSVAAGMLTAYMFMFFVPALAALPFFVNRRQFLPQLGRLVCSVLLTAPWFCWAVIPRMDVLTRKLHSLDTATGVAGTPWPHVADLLRTLGIDFLVGDWATSVPREWLTAIGCLCAGALAACAWLIWREGRGRLLVTALILGLLPLLLAAGADAVAHKDSVGFGEGRTTIYALPGILLLIAAALSGKESPWKSRLLIALLVSYGAVITSDFSLRGRNMFHAINEALQDGVRAPHLVAIDSVAWGHILRLAYYCRSPDQVMLLSQPASNLSAALQRVVDADPGRFERILWLQCGQPVWSPPAGEQETAAMEQVLQRSYRLSESWNLEGTMGPDRFLLLLYVRQAALTRPAGTAP